MVCQKVGRRSYGKGTDRPNASEHATWDTGVLAKYAKEKDPRSCGDF